MSMAVRSLVRCRQERITLGPSVFQSRTVPSKPPETMRPCEGAAARIGPPLSWPSSSVPVAVGVPIWNSATLPSWRAAAKALVPPMKASETMGSVPWRTVASLSPFSRSHRTMVPSLWPASARRSSTAKAVTGPSFSSIVRTRVPELALHSLSVASAPAETIQRSASPLATATTAPSCPTRRRACAGGYDAVRRRAAAVRRARRAPLLVGDGQAGDRHAGRDPVQRRAPAARRQAPEAARPGRHPARGRLRRRRDGFGGAVGWRRCRRAVSEPRLRLGREAGGQRLRSGRRRRLPAGGLGRRLPVLARRKDGRAVLLERLDEVEQLSLALRRIGRGRHEARRDLGGRGVGDWRRRGYGADPGRRRIDLAPPAERARQPQAETGRFALGVRRKQGAAPFGDRLRPLADLDPQRLVDRVQEAAAVRAERGVARRDVLVLDHARRGIGRPPAGDGVIERRTEGIDIRPRPLVGARGGVLLVRAVAGLDQRADRAGMAGDRAARRAEVDEHRRAVRAQHDVVGSDVAVQEVGGMNDLKGVEQGHDQPVELGLPRGAPELLEPGLEAAPVLEVQHHVAGVVGAEVAMHPDDVGMIEARQRLRLLDEAIEAPLVVCGGVAGARHRAVVATGGEIGGKVLLDGDEAVERLLVRKVGDAEAADAQDAPDAIVADELGPIRQGKQTCRWRRLGFHHPSLSGSWAAAGSRAPPSGPSDIPRRRPGGQSFSCFAQVLPNCGRQCGGNRFQVSGSGVRGVTCAVLILDP